MSSRDWKMFYAGGMVAVVSIIVGIIVSRYVL